MSIVILTVKPLNSAPGVNEMAPKLHTAYKGKIVIGTALDPGDSVIITGETAGTKAKAPWP